VAEQRWAEGWWRKPDSGIDPSLWPAYEDFRVFLFIVWKYLNLPDPTPIQNDIARYLQRGPKRRMIQAFRGVGKSWITVSYVIWRLLRNPDISILVVSASRIHAENFTTFCLRLIYELPMCQHLAPKEGQRQSRSAFDVGPSGAKLAPSVKSVGITGQITGSRADVIIPDDIEVPNNSETQMMRDKLSEQVKEFDAVLKPGPDSEIVYLGTPQHEQSIYRSLPDRGYEVRIWPAQYPDEKIASIMGDRLAPFLRKQIADGKAKPGDPTDPRRFHTEDLMERKASYGRAGYALQYMLDTSLTDADKFPLKVSDLIVMAVPKTKAPIVVEWGKDPRTVIETLPNVAMQGDRYHRPLFTSEEGKWADFDGTVMFVDPSGRGKDETAYAVVRNCSGTLWLAAAGGFLGGYTDETLMALALIAKKHGANRMLIEPNFGDGMFRRLLQPVVHKVYPDCMVEDADRATAQKEARIIDTLEPVLMRHKLIVDPSVIEDDYQSTADRPPEEAQRYRLMYQLTRITREKGALVRDDRVDALAGAVAYWVERMNQDSVKNQRAHEASMKDQQLERFITAVTGKSMRAPGAWSSSIRGARRGQ
jgi:hypothetical protein